MICHLFVVRRTCVLYLKFTCSVAVILGWFSGTLC